MNAVPDSIIMLDQELKQIRPYRRIDGDSGQGRDLSESDYDRLILDNLDLLADTLRQAAIIGDYSTLRLLGKQVRGIDILLAEVDEEGEFLRLVLIEDKLFSNPQAKREVLAQIQDYGHTVEEEIGADDLAEMLPDQQDWIQEFHDRIENSMRTGDYLLLICGDRIHERVFRLTDRFIERTNANPLRLTEMALVSMAMYSDGTDYLLIPNIVGAVIGAKRELTVRVEIQNMTGKPIRTHTRLVLENETTVSPPPSQRARTEEEFFKKEWGPKFGEEAVLECHTVLDALVQSNIPGLQRDHVESGRPVVNLHGTPFGKVSLLIAGIHHPVLRDRLDLGLRRWGENVGFSKAVEQFRQALLKMPGAIDPEKKGPRYAVRVSIHSLAKDPQPLIDAINGFSHALRQLEAD